MKGWLQYKAQPVQSQGGVTVPGCLGRRDEGWRLVPTCKGLKGRVKQLTVARRVLGGLLFLGFLFNVCDCFDCICLCTAPGPGTHRDQKRALDPQKKELQTTMTCHVNAGNPTRSSGRAASALNH